MPYLLGLDIGTTAVKAQLYDSDSGGAVASAARPTPTQHPRPEWAEHDPLALWHAIAACIRETLERAPQARPIAALAVASMGEAGLPIDAQGQPLAPIIAYYDPRSMPQAERWRALMSAEQVHAISGQILRHVFGVMKLLWLRDTQPDVMRRMGYWLSVGDFVIWQLTGRAATDPTLASRTMLYDQRSGAWSPELLALAGLDATMLPTVLPSGSVVGGVTERAAALTGLPVGTPVATGGHDHLCGGLAAGVTRPGEVLCSIGTAASLLVPTAQFNGGGELFRFGLSHYRYVNDCWILQAGLSAAGAAQAWLAQMLRGGTAPDDFAALEVAAAESPPGARGVLCLPHLRGSGTPMRDPDARAAFVGFTEHHGPGDMWRALVEGLAYWVRLNLTAITNATQEPIEALTLIGGGARGALLPQALADITGLPVQIPAIAEASAYGAAMLAGRAVGVALPTAPIARQCAPQQAHRTLYETLFRDAYEPLYRALAPIHRALGAAAKYDV